MTWLQFCNEGSLRSHSTSQCLKITQNVTFWHFWHFSLIFVQSNLTGLVTLFDRKLQFFKTRQIWHSRQYSPKIVSSKMNLNKVPFGSFGFHEIRDFRTSNLKFLKLASLALFQPTVHCKSSNISRLFYAPWKIVFAWKLKT